MIISLFCFSSLKASLVAINDSSATNKFLSTAVSTCSTSSRGCNAGDVVTPSIFVDTRQQMGDILGCNFSLIQDRIVYLYNEFGYWSGQRVQAYNAIASNPALSDAQVQQQVQVKYPGGGVYQIVISAVPGVVNRVGQNVSISSGQFKIAAILFFNDGKNLQPLSASCIAVAPHDKFALNISSNTSGAVSVPTGVTGLRGVLCTNGSINFQYAGGGNLGNSPRSIVLQKQ